MTSPSLTPEFSRTYRLSKFYRIFLRVIGCGTAAMGLAAFYASADHHFTENNPHVVLICVIVGFFILILGLLTFRGASRVAVVLTPDAIESIGLSSRLTMRFTEIRGRRREAGGGVSRTILLPRDKTHGKLIIKDGLGFVYDDFYRNWLATVPDLDAIDRDQRRKEGKLRWYEQ
jgi:hypothetical protein